MKNTSLRFISTVVIAAFLSCTTAACFGKFELTRKIYRYNQKVSSDKWVRWLVFLVLAIIPIYGIGMLVDVLFANSVEFWSGSNPVAAGTTKTVNGPDGSYARATKLENGSVLLEACDGRGSRYAYTAVPKNSGMELYTPEGRLVASIADNGNRIELKPQ